MEIFTTSNDGKDWQRNQVVQGEPDQTGIRRFGSRENNRLWVLGSADSQEGVWSMLMVQDSDTSWVRYKLSAAVYLADTISLSGDQFLACGYVVNYKGGHTREKQGVVLFSPDGGRNWSVIYRNKQVKAINSVSAVEPTHAFAVGEGGLVLRVHLEGLGSSGDK